MESEEIKKIRIEERGKALREAFELFEEVLNIGNGGTEGSYRMSISQCQRLNNEAQRLSYKYVREYETMHTEAEEYKQKRKQETDAECARLTEEAQNRADRIEQNARAFATGLKEACRHQIDQELELYERTRKEEIDCRNDAILSTANHALAKANEAIRHLAEQKALMLDGLDETDFLLALGSLGYKKSQLRYFVSNNDDAHYKQAIAELRRQLAAERRREAVVVESVPENLLMHPYNTAAIRKITLAYFELVSEQIIDKCFRTGLKESLQRLIELREAVEKMTVTLGVTISDSYMKNKTELLQYTYELEAQQQRRRDEAREEAEREREERRAQREYEAERRRAEKDEATARRKLEEMQQKAAQEQANTERFAKYQQQIAELEAALNSAIERQKRAISMAQQTRHGFVYVISNVGSFGEGVYKIGLTRRLDPTERVDELGDASVPFPFDIHAMIESEDAPALETALHQAFADRKLNRINGRKEFFRVSLEEIEAEVRRSGIDAVFVSQPSAQQWRDSVFLGKE